MRIKPVVCLLCLLLVCAAAPAWAAPAAFVQALTPEAWASGAGGRQELNVGSQLMARDSLHTNASGKLNVRFSDGTELNMQGSTSVDIVDYVFDENANFAVNIGAGAATLVTGAIVSQNPEAFNITTPLGTVGVRGTTVYISVTNDKVSIVVTDMAPGHSVTIMGLDGNTVTITEPGMQVDLIRGEPTPSSPAPASAETMAAIENPEDDTYSEMPHRDTGEQSILLMEQDMNVVNVLIPVPDDPTPPPVPPVPRTTWPAFILGLDNPANFSAQFSGMSLDGRYVALGGTDSGSGDFVAYLWDAQTGSRIEVGRDTPGTFTNMDISRDGTKVLISWDTDGLTLPPLVYDIANQTTIDTFTFIPANASNEIFARAISGDGGTIVGNYGLNLGYWVLNGSSYDQLDILDISGGSSLQGELRAVNQDGSVIGGFNQLTYAAYWVRQGTSDRFYEFIVNSGSLGYVRAISNNGQWATGETSISGQNIAFRVLIDGSNNPEYINPPSGYNDFIGYAISEDGKVVAGSAAPTMGSAAAAFWAENIGYAQTVESHLAAFNVNLGGAILKTVTDISADGSILLCSDDATSTYLVRIDGDYLGITTPSNIYASLAEVAAGSSASIASSLPIASLSNTSGFSLGAIPAAGDVDTAGGSVLRVWGSGTFSSDYAFNGDDKGASGSAGATWFMDNGFSIGGGVFYSYRDIDSLWGSRQQNESISFGLYGGYAPERTGLRLSLGSMLQSYDLDSRRNYPSGADIVSSSGKGSGWGLGLTGHAGWVFGLSETVTIQPFVEYTFQRMATPDYTENGGPFPVSYERHHFNQNITRIGADAQWDILPTLNLQAWLAWNHRFEDEGPASSGQIIGWESYYFPGARLKQDWGDTGIGLRWRVYDNTTLGFRLGFGIDNKDSGLSDILGSLTVSVDI